MPSNQLFDQLVDLNFNFSEASAIPHEWPFNACKSRISFQKRLSLHSPDKDYPLGDGRRIVNFLSARVFTKLTKPLSIRLCSSSDKMTVQVQVISCWILLPVEFDRAH